MNAQPKPDQTAFVFSRGMWLIHRRLNSQVRGIQVSRVGSVPGCGVLIFVAEPGLFGISGVLRFLPFFVISIKARHPCSRDTLIVPDSFFLVNESDRTNRSYVFSLRHTRAKIPRTIHPPRRSRTWNPVYLTHTSHRWMGSRRLTHGFPGSTHSFSLHLSFVIIWLIRKFTRPFCHRTCLFLTTSPFHRLS